MKKLLGGLFQRQKNATSPLPQPLGAGLSPQPPAASPGVRRALGPHTQDHVYKNGPRSTWDSFFLSPSSVKAASTPPPVSTASSVPVPAKASSREWGVSVEIADVEVFNQNLEMLMREIVAKVKDVITKMIEETEFQTEFGQLCGFINLAADKLLEKGDPSLVLLKNYFSSPAGSSLCEQTAFPSLVLDFVNKIRVYLIKNELKQLEASACSPNNATVPSVKTMHASTSAAELERPIHFLMSCVQAIAANVALMEQFRCELPNVIFLIAEDYPSKARYLRDISTQVLASISDKNFNAGLVWYLNDCTTIGRTIKTMTRYVDAQRATPSKVAAALAALSLAAKSPIAEPQVSTKAPIAAAVSDALGLSRGIEISANETRESSDVTQMPADLGSDVERVFTEPSGEYQLLDPYDPAPGMKALVYTLQKTCRYSLVLLGEFQSSGGYDLLADFIKQASEADVSTLIYLFTLLLPLGTGFSGVCGEDESMATVITCGARNVGAFLAMRDLVLEGISNLKLPATSSESKVQRENLLLQLLTTILQVYTSAYENFLSLEQKTQALAMILSKLPSIEYFDARVIILRIVEYVCVAAKVDALLPIEILAVVCNQFIEFSTAEVLSMIESCAGPSGETNHRVQDVDSPAMLLCECIIKILRNSSVSAYRDEFNAFGLLERGIFALFVKVASSISAHSGQPALQQDFLGVCRSRISEWSAITCLMLKDHQQIAAEFREMQIHHSLYVIAEAMLNDELSLLQKMTECPVFSIFIALAVFPGTDVLSPSDGTSAQEGKIHDRYHVLQSGIESDLARLLEFLQRAKGVQKKQQFVLKIIRLMLQGRDMFWDAWMTCQGHEVLLSLLSSFHNLNAPDTPEENFVILDAILEVICATLDPVRRDNQVSTLHFRNDIGYSTLASCVVTSGVLKTDQLPSVLNRMFELITGQEPPRNKIRNPDAVQVLFALLPHLGPTDAESCLRRLLPKIISNDDISFSRKKQISSLVDAGVFRWIAEPPIIALLQDTGSPSQPALLDFVVEMSREELSTSHLREYIRVIAKGMPRLLGNHYSPQSTGAEDPSPASVKPEVAEEVGVRLLKTALKGSPVPQVMVGTNVRTRMTSGYVHITNQGDRMWPPSNGYTFSCWLRFPPVYKKRRESSPVTHPVAGVQHSTVCVALCEGPLLVKLDGDDADIIESYCVLVGAELSMFESATAARSSASAKETLTVTAVASSGHSDFYIWCHDKQYVARSAGGEATATEMWIRALQQSETISSRAVPKVKATVEGGTAEGALFVGGEEIASNEQYCEGDGLEGYVCLLSVYSLEASGCFTRIYFDQASGCLRVDTGSATSGPSVNSVTKRTSVVFKNVDVNLLRAEVLATASETDPELKEKTAHWHHIAIAHRKSALGNSQATLYIDGVEVATKKLSYPSAPSVGGMQAFIGKDIQICGTFPALPWHLGPTWFVDDVLPANAIACIFLLGPAFRGQFGGHAYRSIGDWPDAIATNQLDRATKRRVEIGRAARRVQLTQLSKAARRQWLTPEGPSSLSGDLQSATVFSDLLVKKEGSGEGVGSRPSESKNRQRQLKLGGFSSFVSTECTMSAFGLEILDVLSSFRLPESDVLFSVNTSFAHDYPRAPSNAAQNGAQAQFIGTERSNPLNLAKVAPSLGGVTQLLLPLIDNAWRSHELKVSLKMLTRCNRGNPSCLAEFLEMNGYSLVAKVICDRMHLVDDAVLKAVVRLAVSGSIRIEKRKSIVPATSGSIAHYPHPVVVDFAALSQIVLSHQLRRNLTAKYQLHLIAYIRLLIEPENPNAIFNARQLRQSSFLQWVLLSMGELCNLPYSLEEVSVLRDQACFPTFDDDEHNDVMEKLKVLLEMFIHLENHVEDVTNFSDYLLLSKARQPPFTNTRSPFRVAILQVLLREIERHELRGQETNGPTGAAKDKKEEGEPFSATMVESVLYGGGGTTSRKKKDRTEGGLATLISPTSVEGTPCEGSDVNGSSLETSLCEMMRRSDDGPFARLEALLSTRILLSLAQISPSFARYLLQSRFRLSRLQRLLQAYSADCDFYTPLIALISNIPIRETKYHDPVLASEPPRQFALPTPGGQSALSARRSLDEVWELLGSLLRFNCQVKTDIATKATVAVVSQLSFQVEVSEVFFTSVCSSSFTVQRLVVQCLLWQNPSEEIATTNDSDEFTLASSHGPPENLPAYNLLLAGQTPQTLQGSRALVCLEFFKTYIARILFEREDFAMHLMFLLDCIDDEIGKNPTQCVPDGQRCWLALVVHVVKHSKALSDNCSFLTLKNLCTLSTALARYLLDGSKHMGGGDGSAAAPTASSSSPTHASDAVCFGTDILTFFLSSVRMCAEAHVTHVVGVEDQQFFYGCLVYCAQTALLSELNGPHKCNSPSSRLLDCLLNSKHFFIQQTKVSSVIICGNGHQPMHPADSDTANTATRSLNAHLNKMKSLSVTPFHKEFGIGAESDRSFLLSLAAELLRWLVDDSERVRYASISVWQFLFQQRMGVLKELLIVEPKVSLLQNMSSSKKEAIDVYHGGFDRLLNITPPRTSSDVSSARISSGELSASHESWLQFHLWLTENYELLKELILARTEPILLHMMEILLSCESIRKVNLHGNVSRTMAQSAQSLNLDFSRYEVHARPTNELSDETNADDSNLGGSSCRLAMQKARLRLRNAEDSSNEEMQDAMLQWRETSARLAHTRAIWHMGMWSGAAGANTPSKDTPLSCDDTRTGSGLRCASASAEPFYLERSVYQQNAFQYRLDFTEGPQRMRLRLMRSYAFHAEEAKAIQVDDVQPGTDAAGSVTEKRDPLQSKLEFHQCIDAYREFMFMRSKASVANAEQGKQRDLSVLQQLTQRCNVDRVNKILKGVNISDDRPEYATAVATTIYGEFLEGDRAALLNVTPNVADDVSVAIASARNLSDPIELSPTLFDVADLEAMHATLGVGGKLPRPKHAVAAYDAHESDEDEEEELHGAEAITQASPVVMSDSEESGSDEEPSKRTNSNGSKRGKSDSARALSNVLAAKPDKNQDGADKETKSEVDASAKIFEGSSDYVYGGIARFLHREDYPPLRSYNAAYVVGMSKTMGVFLICRNAVYFVGGYGKVYSNVDGAATSGSDQEAAVTASNGANNLISPSKPVAGKKKPKNLIRDTFADIGISLPGSKNVDSPLYTIAPLTNDSETALSRPSPPTAPASASRIERWSIRYSSVKEFYRIKYQLRPIGIEYFDTFGSTFFVQYESTVEREEIVKLLFQMPIVNSVFWNPLLRSSALSLSVKRIRQALTKRWLKGGISNFEYLMHLNTMAGRSFNDITQYPVFPWILADYSNQFLDLESPSTFRDLSKPMGALGDNRAALFRERFAAMNYDSAHGPMDAPAFHYGTHYSCSAYVINFLIRLEPFSQLARDLQGGSFDHADRLFRSIPSSWHSASTENLQDVRELVPEFFFLPEFLYNANNYDLGTTQSGEVVSHVKLPAWAHNDPREFVRLHRCALESKYVSEHLHQWIDLVFGCKQTGVAALEAQNVFMHFTYEGAVDLDAIDDPVMRNAMLAQIENFGQTPSKLFTAPHPARKVPTLTSQALLAESASTALPSTLGAAPPGIGQPYEGNTMGSIEAYVKWHTPLAPALVSIGQDYVFLRKHSTTNTLEAAVGDVRVVGDKFLCRGVGCTFMPPRFTKYLEWGRSFDGTMKLRVHSSSARHREANKIVGVIDGAHHSRVNCAAFSEDGVVLVTGGDDAVVNVLECAKAHGQRLFRQICKLVGHDDAVTSVAIDRALNLVTSGSREGCVIVWDLRTRTFLRELGGHAGAIVQVCINSASGNIVACTSTELRLWSINGDLLAATTIQAVGLGVITSGLSTNCESWQHGIFAVTGHSNGTIALWGLLFPADIAREKRKQSNGAETSSDRCSSSSSFSSGSLKGAVRIGSSSRGNFTGEPTVLKAIPTCRFEIKKLLVDHRSAITALRLGVEQRQLVSTDVDGNCIRWVDDSISPNAI